MFITKKQLRSELDRLFGVFKRDFAIFQDEVTKQSDKQHKCLQELLPVIQSLRDEIHEIFKQFNIELETKPSIRALGLQQKLSEYQTRMDALAGSIVESDPPAPPSLNAQNTD